MCNRWQNSVSVRQWSGRPGFNPKSSHTKDSKNGIDAALLSTQHYKVRIKGKLGVIQGMESRLPTIEKEAFKSPSTRVANFY